MKRSDPSCSVEIYERNRPDDTFGFGVVFSDKTLDNLAAADRPSHDAIIGSFFHWDDIDTHFKGSVLRSSGHGFSGLGRQKLLSILQSRARELGAELLFEKE